VLPSSNAVTPGILGPSMVLPPPPPLAQPQPSPAQPYSYVEEGLDVPLHAPRLRVPTDLPLEQTTLMDLLALTVVQGGPTTEEEIVQREITRRNPAFAFLAERFNHPCLLYYRWRLYSLLQQDTLLSWRTTPFQMERARRAYVFVPPPALHVGPECLIGLHQPELLHLDDITAIGVKRARGSGEVGGDDDEIIVARKARRRHRRTAAAAAVPMTATSQTGEKGEEVTNGGDGGNSSSDDSSSSSSSSDSDNEPPHGKQSPSAAAREAGVRDENVKDVSASPVDGTQETVAREELEPALALPPPSAQWISRQCVLNKHVFTVLQPAIREEWTRMLNPRLICAPAACKDVGELCEKWLSRREVARRMAFAVQHADGIHHLLSILLDAVVKTAYAATARSRAPLPTTTSSSITVEGDSSVHCVEGLWYLYVLHDILMNASNMSGGAPGTTCCVNKNERPASAMQPSLSGEDDESPLPATDGSPEAMEALYLAWKRQQQQRETTAHTSLSSSSSSPPSALHHPSNHHTSSPPSAQASAAVRYHRRRQRTTRRRSPYERCGDALELILPTLLEAVIAIALAVSVDKERLPQLPSSPPSESAKSSSARAHHFKVVNPFQLQRLQSKKKDKSASTPDASAAALPLAGGPCLSLYLDAGCAPAAVMSAQESPCGVDSSGSSSSTNTEGLPSSLGASAPSLSPASSAPAVLLLEWLKALVRVWMNVEQPLLLPLPQTGGSPSKALKAGEGGGKDGSGEEDKEAVVAAPIPPGVLWPDTSAGASDAPDVQLAYFVNAEHARVLGLEAETPAHTSALQPSLEVRREAPLLSARACAIIKDRYSFLF
jgi:hypothetical protein